MRTVLLILKKDLRHLWALAILGVLFSFLSTLGWYWDLWPRSSGMLVFVFSQIAPVVVLFILSVAIVQSDPPAGDRAFWRTRPISPGSLLSAKLLLLFLVFAVPSLAVNLYLAFSMDTPFRVALGMVIESTGMIAVESLVFAMIGSVTRSLMQAAAAALAAFLVVVAATVLVPLPLFFVPWRMDLPDHAARMASIGLFSGLAALGLVVHQYATRRLARTLVLGAMLIPAVLACASHWPLSIPMPKAASELQAKPGTSDSVQVMLIPPVVTWSVGYMNDPATGKSVRSHTMALNAALRSIPEGRIIQIESISSAMRFGDGQPLPLEKIGREFWPYWSSVAQATAVCRQLGLQPPALPADAVKQPKLRLFNVPDEMAVAHKGEKGTLTATLKLYELQFRDLARMPAASGSHWTHDGQMWRIRRMALEQGRVVATLQHLRATSVLITEGAARPDSRPDQYRFALALINRSRGEFALGYHSWSSMDAPQWTVDINTRNAEFTEFWKMGGSPIAVPTDNAWLEGAELVILSAEPVGHFDKQVALRDFEIPQMADGPEADAPPYWQ